MRIDVITLFPEMFAAISHSIPGRAQQTGLLTLKCHDLRQFAINKHGQVDDAPFGGEAGMVLRPEPLKKAIDSVRNEVAPARPHVIAMSAQGKTLNQNGLFRLAQEENLLILCGHYKGIDQRIIDAHVDEELSIGDYVLSGGELPAMVLIDSIARLLPGALGDRESAESDSFYRPGLLGWPVYTRPKDFENISVPEVLTSGHHEKIRQWRLERSLELTQKNRPDLLEKLELTHDEKKFLGLIGKSKKTKSSD